MIVANIIAILNTQTIESARSHLATYLDDIYNNNENLVDDIWIESLEPAIDDTFSAKIVAHLQPGYDPVDEFADILYATKTSNPTFFNEFFVNSHSEEPSELNEDDRSYYDKINEDI